jgi:hypothetical protein
MIAGIASTCRIPMQINVSYDSSVASAPAAFKTDVAYVVKLLDAAFSNNVTLNIHIGWGEVGGQALNPTDLGESEEAGAPAYSYADIVNALNAQALLPGASPDLQAAVQTFAGLSDPTNGGTFDIGTAEAKALGLMPGNASGFDGWVGFDGNASDWSFSPTATPASGKYYLVGTIEHEITEVMGRNSFLGVNGEHFSHGWGVPDLFRFSGPGVRELAPGPGHTTGYFSIDNGNTVLGTWNNHAARGDLGDWDQGFGSGGGPGPFGNDAFNDFSNPGVLNQITNTDLTLMHVLGWEAAQPANVVIRGEMYFVDSGQQSASDLMILPGGSVEVAAGGTLNGTITFEGAGGSLEIDGPTAPTNVISGFVAGDTLDFYGAAIGAHPSVKLLPGNVLQIVENHQTYDFQFDPHDNFAGQNFHVTDDGYGGTLIFIDPAVAPVTSPDPGQASVAVSGPGITDGSGDLNAGHVVTLTLNMNEDIAIDTTGGTPTLSLNDGGVATYSGGSGTKALSFTYTVANGENTPDLTVTAVNLNGATAQDSNGHDAVFIGAIGNPPGTLQIDTTPPQLVDVSVPLLSFGAAAEFDFNKPVQASDGATLTIGASVTGAYDAAATAALHDPSKLVFDFSFVGHAYVTQMLAESGGSLQGVTDLAGNPATIGNAAAGTGAFPSSDAFFAFDGFAAHEAQLNQAGDVFSSASAAASHAFDFHLLT